MKRLAHIAALALSLAAPMTHAGQSVCPDAPAPVVTLSYASRYVDDDLSRATIDPKREAEAEVAIAPVDRFIANLTASASELYLGPSRKREAAANCILDRMAVWARAGALSNLETETAGITIGARYAALSLILWQTLPYAYEHPDRASVLAWLNRRMDEQRAFWVHAPKGTRIGNLRAWTGLAGVALAGFQITLLPKARAGAIFQAAVAMGKFQGVIIATTPIGSRRVSTSMPGRTESAVSPICRSTSAAK